MGGFSGPTGGAKAGGKNPDLDFGGLTPGRVSNGSSTPTQPRLGKAPGGFFGGLGDWFGGLFGAQPKQNLLYRPAEMPAVTDTFGAQQPSLLDFKSRFSGARPPLSGARPQPAGALPTLESAQPAKGPLASLAGPARPQAAAGGLSAADRTALQAARIKQMRQPVQVPNPTGRPLTSSKGVFGGRLPGLGGGQAPAPGLASGSVPGGTGNGGRNQQKNIFGDPQASYKKVLLNKLRGAKGQQPVSIFDRLNYGRVATGRAAAAGQKRIAGNWLLKLAGNKPRTPVTPGKLEEAMARGPKPKQPVELPPGVDPNSLNLRALGIEGVAAKPAVQPASQYKVPAYRNQAVPQADLNRHINVLGKGSGPGMKEAYAQIFVAEGGYQKDKSGSSAYGGITDAGLKEAQKHEPNLKGISKAHDLKPQQLAAAHRGYMKGALNRYGGAPAVEKLNDPKTAAAFADTLFYHGANGGAVIVKDAADKTIGALPTSERQRLGLPDSLDRTGPKATIDAMQKLTRGGYGKMFRGRLAEFREKNYEDTKLTPALKRRFDHFRF